MTNKEIQETVKNHLQNASQYYLQDIVSHGIHNLTNEFHGSDELEYNMFAGEFIRQADELLGNAQ